MSEFLELLPPPAALDRFLQAFDTVNDFESIPAESAFGRTVAAAVLAPFPLPAFPRSTVDGYAVRAADTFGASESLPAYLKLIGEVHMGETFGHPVGVGEAVLIHTGGMIPEGCDAVVMIEYTQHPLPQEIEIWRAVSNGENILRVGEDVQTGQTVIDIGTDLRPAEIGGLMALGQTEVIVRRRPKVGIISSGDEIVPPGQPLQPGQIYDINSYALQALVEQAGGEAIRYGILPDQAEAFAQTAYQAREECDLVLFTAGSSVSVRDLTADTIAALGEPGILVHGISVKPGKPTILAVCDGKPIIGLPGNPVSALVIARIFVLAAIDKLLGRSKRRSRPRISARLAVNLSSQAGREDWIGVRLEETARGLSADPVFGKSNLIFTLAHADGLLRIAPAANGIAAGEMVDIELL